MKKSKPFVAMFFVALLAAGLVACSNNSSQKDTATAQSQTSDDAIVANNGVKSNLVICMPEDLETFDPVASSAMSTMTITKVIYTRLYTTDENMQPQPLFVKEMKVVSDNEVDFVIPTDKSFSDGTTITAEDIVYCLERARQSPNFQTLMKGIKSFEVIDATTIKANTEGPVPYIQLALAHPGTSILPKAYVEQAIATNDWNSPVCSGQYVVKSRAIGSSTVIEKNDLYWDAAGESAAKNTSITFSVVPEASSRTIQVQTGEADVNYSFSTSDYATVTEDAALKLYEKTGSVVQYLCMNTQLAPYDNEKVRQAICYAVDREAIMLIAADGFGTVEYSVLPPSTLGYEENPFGYDYDPEKAKKLLSEAGYPNGFETPLIAFNDRGKRVCEAVQQYLAEVGITANIQSYDSGVRMDMSNSNQIPFMAAQWGAMSDAGLVLPRLFTESAIGGMNFSKYTNPKLDKLFDVAQNSYDTDTRVKAYKESVEILAEAAPWCPIYIQNSFCLARADLQGVSLDGESLIDIYQLHY